MQEIELESWLTTRFLELRHMFERRGFETSTRYRFFIFSVLQLWRRTHYFQYP